MMNNESGNGVPMSGRFGGKTTQRNALAAGGGVVGLIGVGYVSEGIQPGTFEMNGIEVGEMSREMALITGIPMFALAIFLIAFTRSTRSMGEFRGNPAPDFYG